MRTIVALAALGGMAATIALASGFSAAKADELSDLRANNQALQQRLDQLAQVGLQHPNLPPGTASLAGSFPRSFLIPGTDTSIQIGGFVQLDAGYALQGGAPNQSNGASQVTGAPSVSGLPLNLSGTAPPFAPPLFNPSSRGNGVFHMSAGDSRLFVETRTPTAWGQALTHLEFDFYGCTSGGLDCSSLNNGTNPYLPRLRLAYGTLGGFMAGQNWVPGNDLAASPEIFDFGGDEGTFGYARAPQIGYKTAVPWLYGGTVGVYAVDPSTQLATPLGALEDDTSNVGSAAVAGVNGDVAGLAVNPLKSSYPDAALVLNWEQPWGHFQLHGVVRDEKLQDGRFVSQEYIGYGGGFSGAVHPGWFGWTKDNLGFQAWAGDGLGHWGSDPGTGLPGTTMGLASNFGAVGAGCSAGTAANCYGNVAAGAAGDSLANAALVRAATIPSWGGEVNYQHWWTGNLRTNLTFGILHEDFPTGLVAPFGATATNFNYNKEGITAHANLIWSPVPFINTGFEYVYGHRQTIWNQKGNEQVLDYSFQVKF